MKKGQKVMVYEDPYTGMQPEGEARLVAKQFVDGEQEFWIVKFLDDGMECSRWIYPPVSRR